MITALLAFALAALPGTVLGDDLKDDSQDEVHRARIFSVDDIKRRLDRGAAPGPLEDGEDRKLIGQVMDELHAVISPLPALLDRLEALRRRYSLEEEFAAVDRERAELRRMLIDARGRMAERNERFDRLKKMRQAAELQKIGAGGLQGTTMARVRTLVMTYYSNSSGEWGAIESKVRSLLPADGSPPPESVRYALSIAYFTKELHDIDLRLRTDLQEDEEAYQDWRQAIDERRTRRGMLAAGAAAVFLLGGGGLWLAWRKRRPGGAEEPGAGTVVGGSYRLDRELGRGGMGVVYEATDLALRRKVAVKRLRPELKESPRDLEMFLAEARVVAALHHPHIVEIYAVVNDGDDLHLVFELVTGQPLQVALARAGRLRLDSACALIRQVGSALDYAHANKVIHRDLKPANVMLTSQGAAKVTDFGLAHQVGMTVARVTQASTWGTPPYMAPEQELGESSPESDLYSLGVMLYEAVTGKVPFPGPNYLAQKREMLFAPPSQAAGLGADHDAVVRRALDPEPRRRFASAAELVQALEAVRAS